MIYLLDTDTIIFWMKGDQNISRQIREAGFNNISASVISKAELYYGAYKSQYPEKNLESIKNLSQKIEFLPFNETIQINFAKIKVKLEKEGIRIDDFDLMIAASALSFNLILVTHNTKHFNKIEDLTIIDWAE